MGVPSLSHSGATRAAEAGAATFLGVPPSSPYSGERHGVPEVAGNHRVTVAFSKRRCASGQCSRCLWIASRAPALGRTLGVQGGGNRGSGLLEPGGKTIRSWF